MQPDEGQLGGIAEAGKGWPLVGQAPADDERCPSHRVQSARVFGEEALPDRIQAVYQTGDNPLAAVGVA